MSHTAYLNKSLAFTLLSILLFVALPSKSIALSSTLYEAIVPVLTGYPRN